MRVPVAARSRWMGNPFVERLWRSLKYACVDRNAFKTDFEAQAGIGGWVSHYRAARPRSALGGRAPEEIHMACDGVAMGA